MTWQCEVVSDDAVDVSFVDLLGRLVEQAAASEPSAPTGDWSLTIRLTDDASISGYHATYFGDPSPTDVVSFPSGDSLAEAAGYLGDIIISVETAETNAVAEGHSTQREIAFLALHGLLHLCGHTDSSTSEKLGMLARQSEMLEQLGEQMGVAL